MWPRHDVEAVGEMDKGASCEGTSKRDKREKVSVVDQVPVTSIVEEIDMDPTKVHGLSRRQRAYSESRENRCVAAS